MKDTNISLELLLSLISVIFIVHVTIQGFLEKAMAKVSASLEAEAAALAGCKIEIMVSTCCIEYAMF